jgi:hypothetical protein
MYIEKQYRFTVQNHTHNLRSWKIVFTIRAVSWVKSPVTDMATSAGQFIIYVSYFIIMLYFILTLMTRAHFMRVTKRKKGKHIYIVSELMGSWTLSIIRYSKKNSKVEKTLILSVVHHRQNTLESTYHYLLSHPVPHA